MTPRTGRPKSDNPKQHEIRTRVDEDTYTAIVKTCEREKITRSDFLRQAIDSALKTKK